jgi:hypothetical protein
MALLNICILKEIFIYIYSIDKMKSLIYFISFLVSFFLILSIYILSNLRPSKEQFSVDSSTNSESASPPLDTPPASPPLDTPPASPPLDTPSTPPAQPTPLPFADTDATPPNFEDNFMLLTTYDNKTRVNTTYKRWFDISLPIASIQNLGEINRGSYFTLDKPVEFEKETLYEKVEGVKLQDVELTGPAALFFSKNKTNHMYPLTAFTILFMTKINNIGQNCILYECLCNSYNAITKDSASNAYQHSVISLVMNRTSATTTSITLNIGAQSSLPMSVDISNIITGNIVLIAVSFDESGRATVYINNNIAQAIDFAPLTNTNITLGSSPVIINKFGKLDLVLYSFAYYFKALSSQEIMNFIRFNNYYINGIDKLVQQSSEASKSLAAATDMASKMADKYNMASKLLDQCVNTSSVTSSTPVIQTSQLLTPNYDFANMFQSIVPRYPSKVSKMQ